MLRARERQIPTQAIHNASIMNAVGCCGLQLYNFGETVSIPFWLEGWEPDSYYDKIAANKAKGMHTLCLLDIKVKEQTIENLMKGEKTSYIESVGLSLIIFFQAIKSTSRLDLCLLMWPLSNFYPFLKDEQKTGKRVQ